MLQEPPVCPYCNTVSRLVNSSKIYHRDFGMIYLCANYPECDTYVGVQKGTTVPLGTMANQLLRYMRRQAHAVFDPLVEWKMERDGVSKNEAKRAAYKWLGAQLNIPAKECHIAMFDEDRCSRTIDLCSRFHKNPPRPRGFRY